ncbi:FixH family protein [Noviherbaspirillum denitrificans]|uniref:Auxin-binding protein n=1 Tax=Noviherbaspirillum denitrificans TaxID=1968433 RepID=A0A254TFC2_9BURK|nr:FixH family protein [Noviherbaspirillum denitrificans]OWW19253.1 Auxin-binding protein [Noviherbaspirillum denitrificans]
MIRRLFSASLPLLAAASLTACMSPPTNLDLSLEHPSENGRYVVKVQSLADPIVINKMHTWEATVKLPSGEPVPGARIAIGGGMPQHMHGYPTQPRVTKELGNGRYLIEGMKFSMAGWWDLKLDIDASAGADKVTFNTIIPQP